MVGSDARMRVSSPITPAFSGTLKSTRMKTRLPARSRSRIESLDKELALESSFHQQPKEIHAAVRVAPFVVVPRQDFHEVAVHHLGVGRVDDGGMRVALEVDGHQLLRFVLQDVLERAV